MSENLVQRKKLGVRWENEKNYEIEIEIERIFHLRE